MLPLNVTLSYYKRRDIQEEMIKAAENKEVAIRFGDKFGSRPDVLNNPNDILELAKQKATSFHCSEELWSNPLQLNSNMKKHDLGELRIGWDLVLDIDCYSKIAADLVIKALKFYEIKSISCKFSGNKGFHIGVPFEAFPERVYNKSTKDLFPEGTRRIAAYISEIIKKELAKRILEKDDINKVIKKTGKSFNELVKKGKFDPYSILNLDLLLISSRHLYRMPYSLHEKSHLVSVPINPEDILKFEKEDADPKKVKVSKFRFLDKGNVTKGEAKKLIVQAFDFSSKKEDEINAEAKKDYEIKDAMPEQFFPPCIKLISNGLADGRKRALFILINFLTSLGWGYKEIEDYLKGWNKKNVEPLRENYLLGQLRYHKTQKKKILPPNCNNPSYYLGIGICKPDNLCNKIKNPVSYAIRKTKHLERGGKGEKKPEKSSAVDKKGDSTKIKK
jgi:DNA primase catalytic subunit